MFSNGRDMNDERFYCAEKCVKLKVLLPFIKMFKLLC